MAPGRLRRRENALLLSADGDGDDDSMLSTTASTRLLPSAVGASARDVARYASFAVAVLSCLCAGSVTAFSLYGHLFQEHLRYTQLQVNAVSIAAELATYLPVPLIGYLCDRAGPAKLSFAAAVLFGAGYLLAAFTYRSGTRELGQTNGGWGLPFGLMIGAFAAIGVATSCLYLSAVTTCAKNFGRGRYKGVALACPIAAYGLSGMWLSQIGSRILYEKNPDGTAGDVDVFKFFIFLAIVLFLTGLSGAVGLRIVDENELIDEAFEELEASGLLEDSVPFQRNGNGRGYGSFPVNQEQLANDNASVRDVDNERKEHEEEEARKKTRLLNEETRMFLKDHTMWFLAAGFFFVTGPGEAYINNVGTIISTLYPPGTKPSTIPTTAASHISILAFTSTIARLFTGSLTDFLGPSPTNRLYGGSANNSVASLPSRRSRFTVSRVVFLIIFAILLSLGQTLLASGLIENHGERFWIVSALIGSGYGAMFSLAPIIIAVIWGVENFGTNWGIVLIVPALGATLWGVAYSSIYQRAANHSAVGGFSGDIDKISDNVLCYGKDCYASTFWAMAISVWIACVMWIQAWKGKGGWSERGIAV